MAGLVPRLSARIVRAIHELLPTLWHGNKFVDGPDEAGP
jgi:hypothetical protein